MLHCSCSIHVDKAHGVASLLHKMRSIRHLLLCWWHRECSCIRIWISWPLHNAFTHEHLAPLLTQNTHATERHPQAICAAVSFYTIAMAQLHARIQMQWPCWVQQCDARDKSCGYASPKRSCSERDAAATLIAGSTHRMLWLVLHVVGIHAHWHRCCVPTRR